MNTTRRESSRPVPSCSGNGPRFCVELDPARRAGEMALVRDAMREWLREADVDDRVAAEILVAAGEACANVLEHSGARRTDAAPAGWIEACLDDGFVHVVIADNGRWIERSPAAFERRNRGRGRLLMAGLMDECEISTSGSGTTVTLRKALPPGSR
ncbi:MAG TPA: ATP-binding protein [Sporichthyaceae bacterium]|nr:ATP-binding protein [Sporichthyaceae bacterium]